MQRTPKCRNTYHGRNFHVMHIFYNLISKWGPAMRAPNFDTLGLGNFLWVIHWATWCLNVFHEPVAV